jgi:hypothetical protein
VKQVADQAEAEQRERVGARDARPALPNRKQSSNAAATGMIR